MIDKIALFCKITDTCVAGTGELATPTRSTPLSYKEAMAMKFTHKREELRAG